MGKSALERSFAKVAKRPSWRVNNLVRVKVRRRKHSEICGNWNIALLRAGNLVQKEERTWRNWGD